MRLDAIGEVAVSKLTAGGALAVLIVAVLGAAVRIFLGASA
jgi:hypothetical protein